MARTRTGPQVLTGNRLSDGRVVFFTPQAEWTPAIAAARVAREPEDAAELERIGAAVAAANVIVDPYLVEVAEEGDGLVPVRLRERFRIAGPTAGHSLDGAGPQPAAPRAATLALQGREGASGKSTNKPSQRELNSHVSLRRV